MEPATGPHIDEVIAFWFGTDEVPAASIVERWYKKDPAFDAEIQNRFGALHAAAKDGELSDWRGSARGDLALLVVLDQFSRNLFRDDPLAFQHDAAALTVARELLRSNRSRALTLAQRCVTLLPFQHAEDAAVQAEGVAAYTALVAEARTAQAPESILKVLESSLDYAKRHQAVIDRFGRFPHRNQVLGRASTGEELEFLKQPGSSF